MNTLLLIVILSIIPLTVSAGQTTTPLVDRQFTAQSQLTDGTPLSVTIVAQASQEGRAQMAISTATSRALALDREISTDGGIGGRLDSLSPRQTLELPADVFGMIEKSVRLAALTNGWFDITAPSSKGYFVQKDWRRISLDPSTRTIVLKSGGMHLDLKRISHGYIADIMTDEIMRAGFSNMMVKVGTTSRISGRDIFTPWKIRIEFGDVAQPNARRAYDYNLTNISAATVAPSGLGRGLIDPRNKREVNAAPIDSITVFAADATTSTAYALAAYALGPKIGLRFIEAHPEVAGIVVDAVGNLFVSKGMEISNTGSVLPEQKQAAAPDGGPNDMRLKAKEEAQDM